MHLTSNNKMKNKKRRKRQSRTKLYFLFCFIEWIFLGGKKNIVFFFVCAKKSLPDFDKLLVDLSLQSCFVCLFVYCNISWKQLRRKRPYKPIKQCFSTCWPLQTFDWLLVILLCLTAREKCRNFMQNSI